MDFPIIAKTIWKFPSARGFVKGKITHAIDEIIRHAINVGFRPKRFIAKHMQPAGISTADNKTELMYTLPPILPTLKAKA